MALLHAKRRNRGGRNFKNGYRNLGMEPLEARYVLSAQAVGEILANTPFPTGLDHSDLLVRSLIASVTTTAPEDQYVYALGETLLPGSDIPQVDLVQSADLINLLSFRQDPRFVDIDGNGYSVVILDTGIDLDHPFFGPDSDGNGVADRIVYNQDFISGHPNANDVDGHGTHVSSTIGSQDGTYTGIAPGVNLIHLKVLDDFGSGTAAALESALQWVVANVSTYNIVSINMSLGFGDFYTSPNARPELGINDELAAIAAQDVIVVSASGNGYYGTPGVSYPSADPNSLSIGAVWDGDNGGPFSWSSGATDFTTGADRLVSFSQRDVSMSTVFAPGAMITAGIPGGGVAAYAGTSMAAPHVAGVAALIQQLAIQETGQRLTQSQFAQLLNWTGMPIFDGDDENDNRTNSQEYYRRIDVLAMANAIVSEELGELTIPFDVSMSSSTASPEGLAVLDFTIANRGNDSTGIFTSGIYLSSDATFDVSDQLLGSVTDSLAGGDLHARTAHTVQIPSDVAPGSYFVLLVVDNTNAVLEVNESDNLVALPITITAPAAEMRLVDLTSNSEVLDGLSQIAFGSVEQGMPSIIRSFRIYNDGPIDLTLDSANVPTGFAVDSFPAVVPALGSADFSISLLGTGAVGGVSGSFSVTTNDADENPFNFLVTGTVLPPDDHGNDAGSATPISVPSITGGVIGSGGDLDWFAFSAIAGSRYIIETSLGSLSDSVLRVFDTDGVTQLAYNDDGGPGLASLITFIAPASDTFYIEVRAYSPSQMGSYTLSVSIEDDHGNDAGHATATSDPSNHYATIDYNEDRDWFSFAAVAGVTYSLETSLITLHDSVLTLFDTDGITQLAYNDDGGEGLASSIQWVALKDGVYFVEVRSFALASAGSYFLSILGGDDHGDDPANATWGQVPTTVSGIIDEPYDRDVFAFELTGGAFYEFETTLGTLTDSTLRIIGANGIEYAYDDDSGVGLGSLIGWHAPTDGVYYVEVSGFGWRTGSYSLSAIAYDDHGNNSLSATATSDPSTNYGILETSADVDWFSFNAYAGVQYRLETVLHSLVDSVLSLFGTDGSSLLVYNDDGGPGWASLIEWTAPADGVYYVQVASYAASSHGSYSLLITGDDDHGDNAQNATFLYAPQFMGGTIERLGDLDWFAFNAIQGIGYEFATSLNTLGDSVLRLYDSDGFTELAYDDDGGPGLASLISWTAPHSGTFYLEVSAFAHFYIGDYGLDISIIDDHGNDAGSATGISIPSTMGGAIEYSGDYDWFSFHVTAGNEYRFETVLLTLGDSVIHLYDTDGVTQLAADDDSGPGLASLIDWTAPTTGVYYLAVRGYSSNTGSYDLITTGQSYLLGDYDRSGEIDTNDYSTWSSSFGSAVSSPGSGADGNHDGVVDAADYVLWRRMLGTQSGGGSSVASALAAADIVISEPLDDTTPHVTNNEQPLEFTTISSAVVETTLPPSAPRWLPFVDKPVAWNPFQKSTALAREEVFASFDRDSDLLLFLDAAFRPGIEDSEAEVLAKRSEPTVSHVEETDHALSHFA